jgi:hypothetical protein
MKSTVPGWKHFFSALPIVLTVVAASYVVFRNHIVPFEVSALLIWVLIVLGLLGIGEVVDRFLILLGIESQLSELRSQTSDISVSAGKFASGHLAGLFLKTRDCFPNFADRIRNARTIWLLGGSLERLVSYHHDDFVLKLNEGATLRFLMMDPASPSVDARAIGLFSMSSAVDLRRDIERTLERIGTMAISASGKKPEARVTSFVPSVGMVLIDPHSDNGVIIVEIYPYNVTSAERAHFELVPGDGKWYQHFLQQYVHLWADSREVQVGTKK